MSPGLVSAIMIYTVVVGVLAVIVIVRRTPRPRWLQAAAWMLQALLIGQAALAGIAVARGAGPDEPGLFLAYVAVAVALLPICGALQGFSPAGGKSSTNHDVRLAVAAAVGLVVQWRMVTTWRSGG